MQGYIGFFDILGYRSFLRNNSATESAQSVLKLISSIDQRVLKRNTPVGMSDTQKARFESMRTNTNWLIFSDTILLTIQIEEGLSKDEHAYRAMYFLMHCASVVSEMFLDGLPVRGALHWGSYVFEQTCIAGTGIVECYDMCSGIELSTACVSDSCMEHLTEAASVAAMWKALLHAFVTPYLIPMKTGETKGHVLDWWLIAEPRLDESIRVDIDQAVWSAFWKHGKDISTTVDSKVLNTIKLARFHATRRKKKSKASGLTNSPATPAK